MTLASDQTPIFDDDLVAVAGADGLTKASGANPLPISGAVTGPLTDAQLRATAVAISATALPLPTGASTAANQVTANTSLASIDTKLTAPLIEKIKGDTDNTLIGNVTDKLKVIDQDAITVLNAIASALGVTTAAILVQNEVVATTRTEVDMTGMTYTVPSGKKFLLTSFMGSYDAQATIHLRFKKQTGGAGAWNQLFRITLEVGGQGQSTIPLSFGNGIYIGTATDKFKVTVEASIANKGTVWACFTGSEI